MAGADIVHFGGSFYGVRDLFDAWVAAGRPPINDAGRTHGEQKYLFDNWQAGKPGFYPADNPDNTSQPRAHMRFAALDIDATTDRVNRLSAAGLRRPYSYEPWHWELPNVYNYPIVYAIPASATGGAVPFDPSEEDDMFNDEDRALLRNAAAKSESAYAGIWQGGADVIDGIAQHFSYGILPIVAHTQAYTAAQLAGLTAAVTALANGDDVAVITAAINDATEAAAQRVIDEIKASAPKA